MSRHRLQTIKSVAIASAAVAAVAAFGRPASADSSVSLQHVARTLGFSYRYLQYENAVELIRPGGVVVVRPGDPFFTVNGRTEPVNGMAPEYRDNDVYVSRAFVSEIRGVGSPYHYVGPSGYGTYHREAPTGSVTDLALAHVPATTSITVSGHATPGAPVRIVLKSAISEDLPLSVIDSVETTADASGVFSTVMSTEPIHFAEAHFIVEASGPDNARPVVKTLIPQERDPKYRTDADKHV